MHTVEWWWYLKWNTFVRLCSRFVPPYPVGKLLRFFAIWWLVFCFCMICERDNWKWSEHTREFVWKLSWSPANPCISGKWSLLVVLMVLVVVRWLLGVEIIWQRGTRGSVVALLYHSLVWEKIAVISSPYKHWMHVLRFDARSLTLPHTYRSCIPCGVRSTPFMRANSIIHQQAGQAEHVLHPAFCETSRHSKFWCALRHFPGLDHRLECWKIIGRMGLRHKHMLHGQQIACSFLSVR